MKNLLLFVTLVCNLVSISAQEKQDSLTTKSNPIIYSELYMGIAGGKGIGAVIGGELNYQKQNNLFTLKYGYQTFANFGAASFCTIGFPSVEPTLKNHEIALLFGQRHIKDGHSWSYSGGISTNYARVNQIEGDIDIIDSQQYFGFPFEVNIKWFKKEKKRFRAYYGLIPIGKPSAFGRSVGFKIYGNIGKFSYVVLA